MKSRQRNRFFWVAVVLDLFIMQIDLTNKFIVKFMKQSNTEVELLVKLHLHFVYVDKWVIVSWNLDL